MCGGVFYIYGNEERRYYFPNPAAVLPVKTKNGDSELISWGRREKQRGSLPLGGWARRESILSGTWDKYFPTPVKIPVSQFMEKDIEGTSHWHDLTKGKFIQGLLARDNYSQSLRVYIVTIEPEFDNAIYHRWPRII